MMDNENYHNLDDGQSILEPTEKDVLCGRGGMSNHHQGNEWYRRLIRSNRPLYRACPKHTKLLVSKAIVQAVEEQGGRFLERSRKTGLWYQVPYKRAVDKTSQGLRERDKDDASAPQITSLPASLRASNGGKIPKPNLSHLAQVTMQHAGMPLPSRKKQPPPHQSGAGLKMAQQQHRQKQQKQAQQIIPMAQQQQMQQQQMQQPQMQTSSRFSFSMGMSNNNNNNNMAVGGQMDPMDAPPPQPGLLSSQSSMFRLFSRFGGGGGDNNRRSSQTNNNNDFGPPNQIPSVPSLSGPGLTTFMGFGTSAVGNMMDANNNNNNMGGGGMGGMNMNGMNNMSSMNNPMNMNNNPMAVAMNNNQMAAMNNMSMNQQQHQQQQVFQQMQQQQQLMQQQQQQQQRQRQQQANQGAGAPALTRLTTQMSDWLTSFWPVGKGGGAGGGNAQNDQAMQQQMNSMQQQQQNNMMAPMGRPNSGDAMMDNNLGMPAPLPGAQMSGGVTFSEDSGRNSHRASVASNSNIAPPAALESSVSTTLLRLASSPSKILGSISTFFSSDNQSATFPGPNDQQNQDDLGRAAPSPTFSDRSDPLMDGLPPPPPPGGLGVPVAGRPSRRTSDLLDDYEETELEARMRAVNS